MPAAEKAAYHQVSGAGRAHTLRRFFGLSPSDKAAIQDRVQRHLDKVLK